MSTEIFFNNVIEHFNKRGYRFTLDDVAKSLRISKRTIYEKYGNKESVMLQSVDWFFQSIKEQEVYIIKNDKLDLMDKIVEVICTYPQFKVEYHHIEDLKLSYPSVYDKITYHLDANWDNTFLLLDRAFDEGVLKTFDKDIFKQVVLGTLHNILSLPEEQQREELLKVLNFIFYGYYIQ